MAAVAEARPVGRWSNLLEERRFLAGVLIAPAVIFILVLVGGPLLLALYLSLTDATGGTLSGDFVGLDNFRHAWADPNFRRALRNTVLFTVVSQAIVAVIGAVLIAVGLFSGVAVATVAAGLGLTGIPILVRWVRESRREFATVAWAAAIALPWVAAVGWTGWPPSDTLQSAWRYSTAGNARTSLATSRSK